MIAPAVNTNNTPATIKQPQAITASDWQAIIDILDNPFIKPWEWDKALLESGLMIIRA